MSQIKGRITHKKLVDWVNEQFIKFEITNYEVYRSERTHFTGDQYAGGACKLRIFFRHKEKSKRNKFATDGYFMCFFFLHEYQDHINDGYEMYLRFGRNGLNLLAALEIDLRKK